MRLAYLTIALLLGPTLGANAQNVPMPAPGARIRVWLRSCAQTSPVSDCSPVTGWVVRSGGDTLVIRPDARNGETRIPWYSSRIESLDLRQVDRVQVSRGRNTHTGDGMAVGIVAGAVLGGGIGGAACDPYGFYDACVSGSALAGVVVGSLSGLIVGASLRSERWQDIALDGSLRGSSPAGVTITPTYARGAVGLNARITF